MLTSYTFDETSPLLIIGAGPVGLAAAAKCAAKGVPFRLIEAGGCAASAVRQWGHVRLFSPWSECIDEDAQALLKGPGWSPPAGDSYPTGRSLVNDYLQPLAELPEIAAHTRYGARVTRIRRLGQDGAWLHPRFAAECESGEEIAGGAVIDASGTWSNPNRLPRHGNAPARRLYYKVPNLDGKEMKAQLSGKRVIVIGAGHSGMTLLIDLVAAGIVSEVIWLRRGAVVHTGAPIGPGSARLKLEERAEAAASHPMVRTMHGITVEGLIETRTAIRAFGRSTDGAPIELVADIVFAPIGFHPDHGIARELQLAIDPALAAPARLAPLIDPRLHSCNSVPAHGWQELQHPEAGYFIAGSKSYGRAPNFALATGYAQVDSLLAHLAPAAFTAACPPRECAPCPPTCP